MRRPGDGTTERTPYTPEQIETCDRRIRKTCHPKQADFVFDTARRISLLTGRGAGKTSGELMRMIRKMVKRPSNCVYVAATKDSAERLAWNDLKRLISESLRLPSAEFNETKKTLRLPNGSSLLLFGCDDKNDIQKLRGTTWHEVAIDEVASIKKELLFELLHEVLGPRMVGTIVVLGTPGKQLAGMFYDATRPGGDQHRPYALRDLPEYENWIKWSSHEWNITDGVAYGIPAMVELYAEQLLTKEREGYSDDNPFWLREYLGRWASDGSANVYIYAPHRTLEDGTIVEWNQWTPKLDAKGFAILPAGVKDWGYGIGIDVGFKDAFALEVFAWSYSDPSRTLYHVYEVYRTRLYAQAIAKLLIGEDLNHDRYGGIVGAIGWPDAMVGDFAGSGGALLVELATVYGITVKAADKPYKYKENAIELMNSDMHEGRIKLMKGSKVAEEMMQLQWIVDAVGKRQENKAQANHGCDASLYIRNEVAALLPAAGAAAPPPKARREDDDGLRIKEPERGNADEMYAGDALYGGEAW